MRYTARRLPRQTGSAAWNAILPKALPPNPLTKDESADVVVVGAGFAGLSAARRLRQIDPKINVVVLEAGRIAEGAAGRNSGFMIDLPHDLASEDYAGSGDDRAMIALNRHAIQFAREAVEDYDIARDYFDEAGKVNGAASEASEAQNRSYAAHLGDLGEAYEMLDGRQMRVLTGSQHYRSGLYTPGTVMLQPAGYIRGLAAGLAESGVRIFEDSPVQAFESVGPDWEVRTHNAKITTPRVILTVNGHLESFGIAKDRLMHIFLFAVMTPKLETAPGGAPRWGVTPADPMGTTVRRIDDALGGDRIVTRTCAVLRSDMRPRPSDMQRAAGMIQRKFEVRFPKLAGIRMEHAWAGQLCLSKNGVAMMKQIDEGVFSGCVQNGLGTARGTLTGIGAAELASGIESAVTLHFGSEDPPDRLPPRFVRDLGANAILRWKEHKAFAE